MTASPHEQLCGDCGLCCDGTLFDSVEVEREALLVLRRRGADVATTTQGPRLRLPCACLDERLCAIYGERPERCRTYRCELLRDVEQGRATASDGRTVVDEARRLRAVIDVRVPEGTRWWSAEAKRLAQMDDTLHEARCALERIVSTHFWQ
jgi:Fe-S-cluster containining protein